MSYHHLLSDSVEEEKSTDGLGQDSMEEQGFIREKRSRSKLLFSRVFHTLPTFLSSLMCILLTLNLIQWQKGQVSIPGTYLRWDNCPIPAHCPRCPTFDERELYQINFFNDYRWQTLDHQYDYLYDDMSYDGLVHMPNEEHGGKHEDGIIAMFHQLHCLGSFRKALQEAYDGKKPAFDWTENIHWPHCIDYLRKAIHCYGDNTIEQVTTIEAFNGLTTKFINGTDDVRACKRVGNLYDLKQKYGYVNQVDQYDLGVQYESVRAADTGTSLDPNFS